MTPRPHDPAWLDGDAAARFAAEERDDLDGEVAERIRAHWARVRWLDRCRAAAGRTLAVRLLGGHAVEGVAVEAGRDWLSLRSGAGLTLVRSEATLRVEGLPDASGGDAATPATDLPPGPVLRRLAADRRAVRLLLVDGSQLEGTLSRVGADAVDVLRHPSERGPHPGDRSVTVPWTALSAVLSG